MAKSRATWPLGRGFDRWYGFHGGETHQFVPGLYHDNHIVRPSRSVDEGYHLSGDLADRTIEFLGDLRAVDDALPFFLYLATGACHSPHHAPVEWIAKYKGRFAKGWDRWRHQTFARQLEMGIVPEDTVLSPRPAWVPSWDSLDQREQRLSERFMECFAGFLSYTDQQIGRVLDFIEDLGDADKTLVILVSDNGASSEGGKEGTINEGRLSNFEGSPVDEMYRRINEIGGPLSHNNYPWGWTMAGNTPFKRWKREVHEGGVADPCIVRLPTGLRAREEGAGTVRRQFAHAIDILPTVLELVGVEPPAEIEGIEQSHLDGTSFAYLLGEGGAEEQGRHRTQHFEMLGSRAIYHDGWKAVAYHPVGPIYDDGLRSNAPWEDDVWELYHVAEDVSEVHDRAAEFPEKVSELVALWWREARRNDVLPLDNRVLEVMVHKHDRRRPQQTYRYFQDGAQVPEWVAVDVRNRSHDITVVVDVPEGVVPSGTLLALGCALGGWSLHLLDGRLRYVHNLHGQRLYAVLADAVLDAGRHDLEFRFEKDELMGGQAMLVVDGRTAGQAEFRRFTPVAFNEVGIGLTCGYEWGPSVGGDYEAPFTFNGTILRAEVRPTGPVVRDPVAEVAAILASQ